MKSFETPKYEIVLFSPVDIVTASNKSQTEKNEVHVEDMGSFSDNFVK